MPDGIYYSCRIGKSRLLDGQELVLGAPHYSHSLVGERLLASLRASGVDAREIIRPEMYHSDTARSHLHDFRPGKVHIIFKPVEEIRVLRGAYNIVATPWEFDAISTRSVRGNPLLNYRHMLSLTQEIWCYSEYTASVMRKYFSNVFRVPVPFPEAEEENSADGASRDAPDVSGALLCRDVAQRKTCSLREVLDGTPTQRTIFLCVLNPTDLRKNLPQIMRGFQIFSGQKPDTLLIIKCIAEQGTATTGGVQELVARGLEGTSDPKVFLVAQSLSAEKMRSLYRLADFYLCASHCEGLCMPLLEAMCHGAIPISPSHTAMADYIDADGAFVIPSFSARAATESNAVEDPTFNWYDMELSAVVLALEAAYASTGATRHAMQGHNRGRLRREYSTSAATESLLSRLEHLQSRSSQ